MDDIANIIERYHIGDLIETGATARVFEAIRCTDKKVFAMKVVKNVKGLTSFPEEIVFNQTLKASGIKGVINMHEYALDYERDGYVMIMDYMPIDLHTYVSSRQTPMTEDECCNIISQIVNILLHMQNVVCVQHMDLKMENVLIDPETKEVKLCDFGHLAQIAHLWTDSTSIGTKCYWAPETIKEGRFYPKRTIVWQIGILAYDLLQEIPWDVYKDGNLQDLTFERYKSGKAVEFIQVCLEPDVRIRVELDELVYMRWIEEMNNNEMV
ncbi:hypothetical protein DPMN_016667 [Dreissena polymorpha]|uniref:Serine/threonine-protein kinase 1 n=2 Tax=Dreissena polymorpha TaxID=45954 RepID=A0A9D4NA38_DREPO|nr:hypothetical protein DPMN_135745 [Dreissena polymorpha]KAH3892548.1 hypothetical protein DPMN_016667 [Dreissena polymorpha]